MGIMKKYGFEEGFIIDVTDYDKWLVQVITVDGDVYVYVDAQTGEVKDINYWW